MKKLTSLFAALLILTNCTKNGGTDPDPNPPVGAISEIVVPDGFDFNMEKTVDFNVSLFATPFKGKASVEVYNVLQGPGEQSYAKFFVLPMDTVQVSVVVPSSMKGVMLRGITPDGEEVFGSLAFDNPTNTAVLTSKEPITALPKSVAVYKQATSGPGCSTGCDQVITSVSGSTLEVASGNTYCVTDGLNGKEIKVKSNATLRVCGSYTNVKEIQLESGATLILNDNASITLSNGKELKFDQNATATLYDGAVFSTNKDIKLGSGNTLTNYGTLNLTNKDLEIQQGASVVNFGTLHIHKQEIIMTGNGSLENSGIIDLDKQDLSMNNNATLVNNVGGVITETKKDIILTGDVVFTNYGTVYVEEYTSGGGNLELHNQAKYINYCNTTVNDDLEITGTAEFENHAGLYVVDDLDVFNQGVLTMEEQSIATVGDELTVYGSIEANGSLRSLVKVSDEFNTNSQGAFSGPLSLCLNGGTPSFGSATVGSDVNTDCNTFIGTTSCITIGNGTLPDADGDGVIDDNDEFPNDPERVASETIAASSIIAEDLWPYTGDYDFNDLVVVYEWNYVVDADSKIKDLTFRYMVKARGAGFDNAFGFALTTPSANVASVTGAITSNSLSTLSANGTETGALTNGAVFMVTDRVKDNLNEWNTDPAHPDVSTPVWTDYEIVFTQAVDASVLNTFNPFVVKDQQRGSEIHLANYDPTDLASSSLFGTGDDNTDLSVARSYVTQDGLPWMMKVPANFSHVIEKEDITQAYLNYSTWVSSGGTQAQDWYDVTVPSNINDTKLFNSAQ